MYGVLYTSVAMALYFSLRAIIRSLEPSAAQGQFVSQIQYLALAVTVGLVLQLMAYVAKWSIFNRMIWTAAVTLLTAVAAMVFVGFGIINITWSLIFCGTSAGLVLAAFFVHDVKSKVKNVSRLPNLEKRLELLQEVRKELDLYLKLVVQAFFALAASIGVSMTILFDGGSAAWSQLEYQVSASAMVLGLGLVTLGVLLVFARPYLEIVAEISVEIGKTVVAFTPSDDIPATRSARPKRGGGSRK